jgi:hypothetical protein
VSEGFLDAVGDQAQQWFPMWEPGIPGAHAYDAAKAVAAGLRCRPFAETVADTLAWDQERGQPDLRTGLSTEWKENSSPPGTRGADRPDLADRHRARSGK